jgi:hypothetical protein
METSQGTRPNYDPCRLITLLTHAGVQKFRLQKFCAGASNAQVEPILSSSNLHLMMHLHGTRVDP